MASFRLRMMSIMFSCCEWLDSSLADISSSLSLEQVFVYVYFTRIVVILHGTMLPFEVGKPKLTTVSHHGTPPLSACLLRAPIVLNEAYCLLSSANASFCSLLCFVVAIHIWLGSSPVLSPLRGKLSWVQTLSSEIATLVFFVFTG